MPPNARHVLLVNCRPPLKPLPVLIDQLPVLSHWAGVRAAAGGDAGARGYLAGRAAVTLVECGDLAGPDDVDTPEQLAAFDRRRIT